MSPIKEHPLKIPRTIVLSKSRWIVLDWNQGLFRAAYYRPWSATHDGANAAQLSLARLEKIAPRGVDLGEKKYVRFSGQHQEMHDALQIVLGEGEYDEDPDTVEFYIRSLPWAEGL